MKLDKRTIAIGIGIILVIIFIAFQNRSRLLPTGKFATEKQIDYPTPVISQPITGHPQVEIVTSKGTIVLELDPAVAPQTVTNYLSKWSSGYCDDKTFHRVEDWVVQGCDPSGDGTGGLSNLPTETSSASFTAGSLGVARKAVPKEYSNDSQFFIVKKDAVYLDGEYTHFGRVVSGMDIVNQLAAGDKILSTAILSK